MTTPPPPERQSEAQDGGPAFPHPEQCRSDGIVHWPQPGMSLRDWFAGQALAGICANSAWDENGWPARAKAAYDAADALLSARGETK